METGISTIKDLIEVIVWIVGAVSLAFAAGSLFYTARTYRLNESQFNFTVIVSCTERFQQIMAELKSKEDGKRFGAVRRYVDLCNEELFYFSNKYLPDEVVDEWLEGMVFYLPHLDPKGQNLNPHCLQEIVEHDLLDDYPRIKRAFSVNRHYDLSAQHDMELLIAHVKRKIELLPTMRNELYREEHNF